jgi:hypothetical protein
MPKPNLRVLKWIGTAPAVAACSHCNREFKVPLTALKRVLEAQEYLRRQFAEHKCPALHPTGEQMVDGPES